MFFSGNHVRKKRNIRRLGNAWAMLTRIDEGFGWFCDIAIRESLRGGIIQEGETEERNTSCASARSDCQPLRGGT
jgi:hypothetical protein